ncbi:Serine/threonine-protein phosphatase 2A regulatory subunit B'' subunit beta [Heterocephalus glaber]|uniref:Serine/threonine-protein phosphatase 2A regulatory subunit B'' subunit beta n=1 Tax=Heterocephalus glaber TaxID=10181 RepID=G5B571_HETGA|nr:Serine/threonine-protein phosphatase 2A regulatory subunit B'' subunit beta [Heterocephalus glaber]
MREEGIEGEEDQLHRLNLFFVSEEAKKTLTSIKYWFCCMDLDGDWVLSTSEWSSSMGRSEAAGQPWDAGYEVELSPVDQKLEGQRYMLARRPFFEEPSPLGDVDL